MIQLFLDLLLNYYFLSVLSRHHKKEAVICPVPTSSERLQKLSKTWGSAEHTMKMAVIGLIGTLISGLL